MEIRLFLASFSLSFILLLLLLLPVSTCPENFECGSLGSLKFPYTNRSDFACGFCMLDCNSKPSPQINFQLLQEKWFEVKSITNSTIKLYDPVLEDHLKYRNCTFLQDNITLPSYPSIAFTILNNITLFRCNKDSETIKKASEYFSPHKYCSYKECDKFTIYFTLPNDPNPAETIPSGCTRILLPAASWYNKENPALLDLLTAEFDVQWHLSGDCYDCYYEGQTCRTELLEGELHCANAEKGNKKLKIILGTVIPGCVSILIVLVVLLIWRCKKRINGTSYFLSRGTSEPSSKPDLEGGSVYFGVSIFSYSELEKATNNFDASKELGDGGFGTVYHGKLRDGREVAVKRLYEHNFKRMEQFMNEVEILTRLRHRNLVTLYGCTSRRSRELLLVYEYIPNGTVADHLHGDKAHDKYLTWSHRINIAIETADALAYLHKSDIIHRDVKTNNILLDHNFCVKVADFGLSRLFPNDVSHISTAPQGTPGYVDPEYHQCYQLTDRSDVYSFGVVLIELVSSMPAVDISRHRHEVNLANLAINRIQRCAFDELIDSSLGYKSDPEILRMTTSVAELAFRCLQHEKEMRPSMEEVLETLKEIQNSNESLDDQTNETNEKITESRSRRVPPSPESEDIVLLKNVKCPSSPNSVADVWVSSSTTTSTSS